jgi:hypothetical protein
MKHLKPIQILTDDAIHLLERVKIHLDTYNDVIPSDSTKSILAELSELIEELKS